MLSLTEVLASCSNWVVQTPDSHPFLRLGVISPTHPELVQIDNGCHTALRSRGGPTGIRTRSTRKPTLAQGLPDLDVLVLPERVEVISQ